MERIQAVRYLAVAKLGSPRGLEGEVRLFSYSGETDHICNAPEVLLGGEEGISDARPVRILRWNEGGWGTSVLIEGYDSPEKARQLSGCELFLPREQACPLGESEYYIADLVGLSVMVDAAAVGRVSAVCEGGADDLLEITLEPGDRKVLVPFRKEFVGTVDTGKGELQIISPWILE